MANSSQMAGVVGGVGGVQSPSSLYEVISDEALRQVSECGRTTHYLSMIGSI
ncbi:unnamed protein product [Anisakis simplex]|uniref:Uncharacterized protein n=1 Tax=Anisakis simplex TaxID=6269 RepID=A0A0M3JIT8_ANISI|nr:unnamed protein product [Anisakis simplex]